jgi:BirA family biotin operon repressor/biotin-[acetyl-CoA-carboxylase] ligase
MVAFSVLLRPRAPRERWTWLPLLAGLAVAGAIGPARLKWPNDVLLEDKKVCGILAEAADDAVVIGIGVNTAMTPGQLPVPTATSLAIAGLPHDPTALVAGILRELDKWYRLWEAGQDISAAYTRACATISRDVNVIVSESEQVAGRALRVDSQGCLVVATAEGERAFSAGDVVHVR